MPNAQQQTNPPAAKPQNLYESTYKPLPSQTTVIRNATILTAAGPVIERGSILLQNGKIAAVGADRERAGRTRVVDRREPASGSRPAIIDTHSHLGVYAAPGIESLQDGNEMTNPVTAEVWAEHSIWPQDPQFELALAGGVTTMQILPGSGNLIGGRSVTVKNVPSRTAEGMKFPGAPAGLKMACGENPKRVYGQRNQQPSTRMGNVAVFRRTWQSAVEYRDKWKKWRDEGIGSGQASRSQPAAGDAGGGARRRDPRPQPLLPRRRDGDDDPPLEGVRLQDRVRSITASRPTRSATCWPQNNICASMWADWWGFKLEAYDGIRENIALVERGEGLRDRPLRRSERRSSG